MSTAVHSINDATQTDEIIKTTLYDLIAAINSEVDPTEDYLVVATVMHLLQTGRIRLLRESAHVN
jgi:pyruvate/2-oxoglutarate dehydrogenase complex dihydrolipoamide acyltransferase (E2) component